MNRRTQIAAGLAVGIVAGLAILLSIMASNRTIAERTQRRAGEVLTRGQVAAIAQRVLALERPSDDELRRRVEIALRQCLHDPTCLRLLATAVQRARPAAEIRRQLLAHRAAAIARRRGGRRHAPPPAADHPRPAPRPPGPRHRPPRPPRRRPTVPLPPVVCTLPVRLPGC
jgi:hypothetical protein